MSELRRVGAIDISEDMAHERREWIVQRIGWAAMLGFLVAAALGLFGSGPLARATAAEAALEVEYPIFARLDASDEIEVEASSSGPELRISIDRDFLTHNELERITPEPDAIELDGERVVHVYRAYAGRHRVVFELRARRLGPQRATIAVDDGDPVHLRQFVYP